MDQKASGVQSFSSKKVLGCRETMQEPSAVK